MPLSFLAERFSAFSGRDAIAWRDRVFTYADLAREWDRWGAHLDELGVPAGAVVSLEADFSPDSVALLLALLARKTIVVPISDPAEGVRDECRCTAQVELRLAPDDSGELRIERRDHRAGHPLYDTLRETGRPGLVLFSSGSSGVRKGVVHDCARLLSKYRRPRRAKRTITFFLFDHIGGLDTCFYTLSSGGCLVLVEKRSPDAVCAAVARHRAEVLPVSPTFLNLLLVSGAHDRHDLSSLEILTYGTEVMPLETLRRIHALFPGVSLLQKYGMSEIGTPRSRSRQPDSPWVRIGGEGFDWRVVEGELQIRAASAMLGYLNAPAPFTDDGWLRTGDRVEVDGDYLLFRGRASEVINVGGEKVHPAEVENVLLQMPGVEDAVVRGEPHPFTGQVVCANVRLAEAEPLSRFRRRMREFCRTRLTPFKIPQRVHVGCDPLHGERYKRMRRTADGGARG